MVNLLIEQMNLIYSTRPEKHLKKLRLPKKITNENKSFGGSTQYRVYTLKHKESEQSQEKFVLSQQSFRKKTRTLD